MPLKYLCLCIECLPVVLQMSLISIAAVAAAVVVSFFLFLFISLVCRAEAENTILCIVASCYPSK